MQFTLIDRRIRLLHCHHPSYPPIAAYHCHPLLSHPTLMNFVWHFLGLSDKELASPSVGNSSNSSSSSNKLCSFLVALVELSVAVLPLDILVAWTEKKCADVSRISAHVDCAGKLARCQHKSRSCSSWSQEKNITASTVELVTEVEK